MDFKPPTPARSLQAIGSTRGLPKSLQWALDPRNDFQAIPVPRPGDWLTVVKEPGQPFEAFVKSRPNRPDAVRNKIYVQPLGEFPESGSPSVQTLWKCAANYFVMDVEVLPSLSVAGHNLTTRVNRLTGNRQILAGDVLALLKKRIPADAFCLVAITMEDLYPHPSWNFVFGQASLRERVGVLNFARYDPVFYGEKRGEDYHEILLRRSCNVLVHEAAHMFSLEHCIYFTCVLNGSNHLQESNARPLSLCPVCLRKLQFRAGFDVVDRCRKLLGFYRRIGFDQKARWTEKRLKQIRGK